MSQTPIARAVQCAAGSGLGRTRTGAFHAALASIGVAEFNLITLSSVVPVGWRVDVVDRIAAAGQRMGDRLIGVLAANYVDPEDGADTCAAALAWAIAPDGAGGYMAEATSDDEVTARRSARIALGELTSGDGRTEWECCGLDAAASAGAGQFACALVFAAYTFESWT